MKNKLSFFGVSILMGISFSDCLYAQKDAEIVTPYKSSSVLTNPAPIGFQPVAISYNEAAEEASANATVAGFSAVYFTSADLQYLLSDSRGVGLRFYNAREDMTIGSGNIVAVAVKSDGSEINPALSKSYIISRPLTNTSTFLNPIAKSTAKVCVSNACNTPDLIPYTAFFSRSIIDELLKQTGAAGVKLIPASRKFEMKDSKGVTTVKTYRTMMAVGVALKDGKIADIGSQYLKSLEPCPYHCPTDNVLLMPAKY
jgi:hypothetical protein